MTGEALPATQALLRAGELEMRKQVGGDDREVVFETELTPGELQLQSWFSDEAGEFLAGAYYAYYVEVERLVANDGGTDSSPLCSPTDPSCLGAKG